MSSNYDTVRAWGMETCTKCGEAKPVESFHRNGRGGRRRFCGACAYEYVKGWKERNPERVTEKNRQQTLKVYGLTLETYQAMLDAQGGVCAICHQPEIRLHQNGRVRALAVDHNHDTDEVRGLLCNRCNRVLGYAEDDAELLEEMASYLYRFQERRDWA